MSNRRQKNIKKLEHLWTKQPVRLTGLNGPIFQMTLKVDLYQNAVLEKQKLCLATSNLNLMNQLYCIFKQLLSFWAFKTEI